MTAALRDALVSSLFLNLSSVNSLFPSRGTTLAPRLAGMIAARHSSPVGGGRKPKGVARAKRVSRSTRAAGPEED
jgi:hypothetical protein